MYRRERISLAGLFAAGVLGMLGEAAARFGWPLPPPGLPFPPEALAQGLFAVVPMDLFSLAIGWLGAAAQWVAFAVMLVLWALVVGALSNLAAAVASGWGPLVIFLAGALVGFIVQGVWWLAAPFLAPGGWAALGPAALWPGALLPAVAYGVAALVARTFRRPRY